VTSRLKWAERVGGRGDGRLGKKTCARRVVGKEEMRRTKTTQKVGRYRGHTPDIHVRRESQPQRS